MASGLAHRVAQAAAMARSAQAAGVLWVFVMALVWFWMPMDAATAQDAPEFSQQELDQMLAPVALYPDGLLSQILMAASYPLEVVEAQRWTLANPNATADAALQAVDAMGWDPSVKSLVAFPRILQTMSAQLEWTRRLGDAFLGQQQQVMDTIQVLRKKAYAAGNLVPSAQQQVTVQGDYITIAPTQSHIAYAPYYDPALVYGPWWWPQYPPVFWAPWPGYSEVNGLGLWEHNPGHRQGVAYRRPRPAGSFFGAPSQSPAPPTRRDFRGFHSPPAGRPPPTPAPAAQIPVQPPRAFGQAPAGHPNRGGPEGGERQRH
jgi:hypothetical protein